MTDKDGDGRESNSEILTKDDNDDSKDDDDNCGGGFIKAEVVSSSGTIVLSLICLTFCSFFHSFTICMKLSTLVLMSCGRLYHSAL